MQSVVRIMLLTKCDMQNSDHGFVVAIPWDFVQRFEQYRLTFLVCFTLRSLVTSGFKHGKFVAMKRKRIKREKNYTSIL